MQIQKNHVLIFLFLAIVISIFVLFQNFNDFDKLKEQEILFNAEEAQKAELLAEKTTEVKIIEKLSEIYSEDKVCSSQEFIDRLNFVNTFSFATGISVEVPPNQIQAKEVINEAGNCIPEINKSTEKKQDSIYLVSYISLFPENCSLPEKEMKLIIEANVKNLTTKIIEGELDKNTKGVLGNNLYLLDSFGNCPKEVVYRISIDSGILR